MARGVCMAHGGLHGACSGAARLCHTLGHAPLRRAFSLYGAFSHSSGER